MSAAVKFSPGIEEAGYDYQDGKNHGLHHIQTAGAISISPEALEKFYLAPRIEKNGQLGKKFGNATAIGLVGFLLALTPLSCDLMQWRGAGSSGAEQIPQFFFFGGLLQVAAGLLEWFLGNTYPSIIFCTFGAFFLSFAGTLNPSFAAFSSFATAGQDPSTGLTTRPFNAGFGFFLIFMGLLSFFLMVCALRTNICFVIIFLTLVLCFIFLTVAYWLLAEDYLGNASLANRFIIAGGACAFVCCVPGWWVLFALLLESVDFPLQLPLGDLSHIVKSRPVLSGAHSQDGEV